MPKETSTLQSSLLDQLQPVIGFLNDYPVTQSMLIILISLLVAGVVRTIITRVLGNLVKFTSIQWDDHIINQLRQPLFTTIILLGVMIATIPLKLSSSTDSVIYSIIATLLVIVWSAFAARAMRVAMQSMSNNSRQSLVTSQTRPLFENLAFILIIIISVYFIFRSWNIDMTAWLASAGIVGIAIGFAAKDTLANLFSGVFILADAPYKLGDYVVLDSNERGKVTAIGLRSTRLLTRDDVEITIPNAIMGNSRIINESGGPYEKFRIRIQVGVAYGSDIDQVKALLMQIAVDEPNVCTEPDPRVRFRAFGASSLDLELLCWVDEPEVRGRVSDALYTTIYKTFNAEGVEIPYSKHDVFIKEMPTGMMPKQES